MMNKSLLFLLLLLPFCLIAIPFPKETYVISYGEGPIGQQPLGFDVRYYTREEGLEMAKKEAEAFVAGQIYGYSFEYQVENQITKRGEFFVLFAEPVPDFSGRNATYQPLESESDRQKLQFTYQLLEQQKSRRRNFGGARAESSRGEDCSLDCQDWDLRYPAFEKAVKNAILNKARKDIKSRPECLRGKLLLREAPIFSVKSGCWRVLVHISIVFDDISYQESY